MNSWKQDHDLIFFSHVTHWVPGWSPACAHCFNCFKRHPNSHRVKILRQINRISTYQGSEVRMWEDVAIVSVQKGISMYSELQRQDQGTLDLLLGLENCSWEEVWGHRMLKMAAHSSDVFRWEYNWTSAMLPAINFKSPPPNSMVFSIYNNVYHYLASFSPCALD